MGKLINLEFLKQLKFDNFGKWYIYKPETMPEKVHPLLSYHQHVSDIIK